MYIPVHTCTHVSSTFLTCHISYQGLSGSGISATPIPRLRDLAANDMSKRVDVLMGELGLGAVHVAAVMQFLVDHLGWELVDPFQHLVDGMVGY